MSVGPLVSVGAERGVRGLIAQHVPGLERAAGLELLANEVAPQIATPVGAA
jgi:hypothetical protein